MKDLERVALRICQMEGFITQTADSVAHGFLFDDLEREKCAAVAELIADKLESLARGYRLAADEWKA